MTDCIEYYRADDLIVRVESHIVPPVGSYINIRGKTFKVVAVTYCIDYADHANRRTRANIDLEQQEVGNE